MDGALGLDGGNSSVDILGDNVTAVKHAAGHVLAMTRIAFHHLVGRLEASIGDLTNSQLLMVSLLGRDDWGISDQWEVDTRVWHQVSLEFSQVNIEGSVKAEGSSDGRYNLADQSVEIGVAWAFNVQVTTADIIYCFIINHESTVRVLQSGVGGQDGVVGLNDSSGDLGSRVDGKLELGLLSVVDRKTFHEQGSETGSGTSTERVEDQEALESSALVREFADTVQDQVNNLLSDGVVTTSVVVGSIFLSGDKLFRVEQGTVGTSADLINDSWFQIDEDGTGYVLSGSAFREESVERVINSTNGLVRWHLTIRLDSMFQTVKLPASITNLHTSLSDVDRDTFALQKEITR